MNTPSPPQVEPLMPEELATVQRRHNEAIEFGRGKTSLHATRLWAQEIGIDAHRDRRVLLATITQLQAEIATLKGEVEYTQNHLASKEAELAEANQPQPAPVVDVKEGLLEVFNKWNCAPYDSRGIDLVDAILAHLTKLGWGPRG